MTTQSTPDVANPAPAHAVAVQDLLLVSSFGLWAMLLGFVPAVAFRLLVS